MAITAWSAKVDTNSICFSVNGRTVRRMSTNRPIVTPSRKSGAPSNVRAPAISTAGGHSIFGIRSHIMDMDNVTFE